MHGPSYYPAISSPMGTREGFRRPGRPRQNWKEVVTKDLRKMGISWDEVEEDAEDRRSWWNRVGQCVCKLRGLNHDKIQTVSFLALPMNFLTFW